MPLQNRHLYGSPISLTRDDLAEFGATVEIEVSPGRVLRGFLSRKTGRSGHALIDTGSSITCVDRTVIEELGIHASGAMEVPTAAGREAFPTAKIEVSIPSGHPSLQTDLNVLIISLAALTANRQRVIALLGRDVLSQLSLTYNGVEGAFVLLV